MKISVRQHIIYWVGYVIWDYLQSTWASSNSDDGPSTFYMLLTVLLGLGPKLLLFYFSFHYTLRPLAQGSTKKIAVLLQCAIACLLTLLLYRAIVYYIVTPHIYHASPPNRRFFNLSVLVFNLFDLLIPVCILLVYEMYRSVRRMKERESALEKEKLRNELSFLKAQINPHFLFNVLSTIHALSRQKAPEAADVTLKLSQLMRFMLYEAKSKRITLAEEVKLLEDFIELERVRFSNKLTIRFNKKIDDATLGIAPLLLLPFVENAFKYSAGESRFTAFVYINLTVQAGLLRFEVENSMEEPLRNSMSTHIGLANIKRQLELTYPDHELICTKKEETFFVSLQIKLAQDEKS